MMDKNNELQKFIEEEMKKLEDIYDKEKSYLNPSKFFLDQLVLQHKAYKSVKEKMEELEIWQLH